MFYAYFLAQLLTFSALFLETYRIGLLRVGIRVDIELGKHLVTFSIPLMLVGILNFMMTRTDTLMLGYYKGSEVVGVYNAASPLARLIPNFSWFRWDTLRTYSYPSVRPGKL